MADARTESSTSEQPGQKSQGVQPADLPISNRLMSLDALRGFDMFWIVGGEGFVLAIAKAIQPEYGDYVDHLLTHPEWNGYTPYDQIFPMFMFIAGVAVPFALLSRVEQGDAKYKLALKIIRRGLMLVFLGAVYNGLLSFDFANQRYPSVLGRIGLGYMFAALIAINTRPRGQIAWIVALLVGYWAAMKFIPVPGFGPGDWEPGHTLADYVDRLLLPGRLYKEVRDPEGILSTIPSIATVLSGVLAGHWLRAKWPGGSGGVEKAIGLAIAGLCSVALGWLCDLWFPINKNLWTSSFVLWTSGWSALLLSLFYLVIDVWRFRRWAFVFVVIGMNAITLYLVREFIDFPAVFNLVFGRAVHGGLHPTLIAGGEIFLVWWFGYALYRAKIFIRV